MSTGHRPNDPLDSGLDEFLRPTPSAAAKLLAAWDGLQTETKIVILEQLCRVELPAHLAKGICLRALDSRSGYVRYLASARFCSKVKSGADQDVIAGKIKADPEPLVRYALLERSAQNGSLGHNLHDAKAFFSLPQEARLAMVRNLAGAGRQIARIVEHALSSGIVSDVEVVEILCDYVNNPRFQEYHSLINRGGLNNRDAEWDIHQELNALWRLVPVLPHPASRVLIKALPERAGISCCIPREVLDNLTDKQATWLLERPDIELKAMRKHIALGRQGQSRAVRLSAIKHNFDLSYEDFSALAFDLERVRTREVNLISLDWEDKQKLDTLKELANSAEDLSPVFYEAIRDLLLETPLTIRGASQAAAMVRQRLHLWLAEHQQDRDHQQRRELRLYRLAKEAVPWNKRRRAYQPSGKLAFLSNRVTGGDTWATFVAFSTAWKDVEDASLDNYLPRLHEIGETSTVTDDRESDTAMLVSATTQLEGRLNEVLALLRQGQDYKNLENRIAELVQTFRAFKDEALASRKALEPITARLARAEKLDRIRIALFVLIALLTVALLLTNLR